MNFIDIIRLLVRNAKYILATGILLAGLLFWSTKDGKKQYSTHTLLNTGLISGYTIESNKSSRVDYAFTNNEMENLINLATSFETLQELSAQLLTQALYHHHQKTLGILPENYPDFMKSIQSIQLDSAALNSPEKLYTYITKVRDTDKKNSIYELTNSKDPFFGIEQLETISVLRQGNSDMMRMEYSSIDPHFSQLTLELITEIFIYKHKTIKEGQTDSVIQFFKEATDKTSSKLKNAEDELLSFRVDNRIINYYEQTRFISGNKEELDKQYQEELKVLAGASSALEKIEIEIEDKTVLASLQSQIAENRSDISRYSAKLTELDLVVDSVYNPINVIAKASLNGQIDSLKDQMSKVAERILLVNQTPNGIETKDLLTQWLNNTISKEESSAKLQVMKRRQQEYGAIYDRFAPLGSTLKRLEREIDVAEREYLENLHSYNQARLHKYNMMMSTNLKVIDAPYYPAQPEASKRMMMVVLAFVVGCVLVTALVIGLEFMDSSLKNPEHAQKCTKLTLGGILPKTKRTRKNRAVDFDTLNYQALNLFIQELRAVPTGGKTPKKVLFLSTNVQEGKSFLMDQLDKFNENLIEKYGKKHDLTKEFDFEKLAPILHHPYKKSKVRSADIHVLVCRANRQWTDSDRHALKVYKKICGVKPILFLNGVTTDVMEELVGEIPRKRSWLRIKIKQLLVRGLKPSGAF